MVFEARCRTTAMGIMPHTDVDRAMSLALSLDVPFWPQLFRVSFLEDTYVQAAARFPGVKVDAENRKLTFDSNLFYGQLVDYAESSSSIDFFALRPEHSLTYHRFLERDLAGYPAIHGQFMGPISFGFKIVDEDLKPILYREDVRSLLLEFLRNKVNAQYRELKAKNANAFVWIDEPGIDLLFSAYSGYTAEMAKADLRAFFEGVEGPKGVHLCGNPDWDFLLTADLDILSMDAYHWGTRLIRYFDSVKRFVDRGGILAWGLVPTGIDDFSRESTALLVAKLEEYWNYLVAKGVDKERLLFQSLLAPATCCLLNADRTETVERAFAMVQTVSRAIQDKYRLLP